MVLQIRTAGSNVLFGAVTEISDSILKGAEASGVNGMVQFTFSSKHGNSAHGVVLATARKLFTLSMYSCF